MKQVNILVDNITVESVRCKRETFHILVILHLDSPFPPCTSPHPLVKEGKDSFTLSLLN